MLELSKTRAKKSSLDMFNLYVVLTGHDRGNDTGRSNTCWRKIKASSSQTKSRKNQGLFQNISFSRKPFEDFNEKKKTFSLQQKPRGANGPQHQYLSMDFVIINK